MNCELLKGGVIIKELLLKRKSRFFLYILACFFPVISQLLSNLSIALLFGSIQVGTIEYFIKVCLITFGIIVLGSIFYIISRFMRISYMRDTLLDVREKAFDKILKSSYKSFNMKSKDSYISNLINDINIFENNFFLKLINVIFNGGMYIVSLIILIVLDFKFAIGIFATSILLFFINKAFEKKTISLQEQVSKYNEDFSVEISNTFNGLEILKLNNIEDKFLEKSLKSINRLERKKFDYGVFITSQDRFSGYLGFLIIISIMLYLLLQLSKGISLTRLTFMLQMSNGCVWSITRILPLLNELKASTKIYDKITKGNEELNLEQDVKENFMFKDKIQVNNLSFDYDGKEIFNEASFSIEKGKKYLIKGPSGAGKSTLIKLLSMIYDDYKGEILMDDTNYRNIKEDSLNENVSFIYQDVFLFEDTIFNNISLFKPYSREEVLEASTKAGLSDLLSKKDNGLDEILLENGKNLSGGERQRTSIARAIVKNSSILFVDEGTSSLDEELGRRVEDTILSLDSTVIAISHRYYKGITEKYDYVLEITNGKVNQYSREEYFQEVATV